MPLVVGLWNVQGDLDKAKNRIGDNKSTRVVTTLADGQEQIRLLVQRLFPIKQQAPAECSQIVMEEAHSSNDRPSDNRTTPSILEILTSN